MIASFSTGQCIDLSDFKYDVPLDVCYDMEGRGERLAVNDFQHSDIKALTQGFYDAGRLGSGCHFFAPELPWNAVTHAL